MPCYNSSRYIADSISSVIQQTYQDWELLIVDDGSKDDSVKIIEGFVRNDSRLHLLKQKNSGSAAARNNGIRHAKGQYLALLDSDDIWLPNFLESQINYMHKHNAGCVYSSYEMINEQSNSVLSPVIAKDKVTLRNMQIRNYIGCLTGLFDQGRFGKVYLQENLKSILDDYAFWIDVITKTRVAFGNQQILAKYRVSANSTTGNKRQLIKNHYLFYRNHLGQNLFFSFVNTILWAVAGLKKYL